MDGVIRPLGRPGDLGWVVQAHGELYAAEYGWRTEPLVAEVVAGYGTRHDPAREAAWIAELGGDRVGCVFCVAVDERTAQLRLLLLCPQARGRGLGGRLVTTCVDFARAAGYREMVLWTQAQLVAARHIYTGAGFVLTGTEQHDHFGTELHGHSYQLQL
jgi:GNAT superfamily N-acetyltransferase